MATSIVTPAPAVTAAPAPTPAPAPVAAPVAAPETTPAAAPPAKAPGDIQSEIRDAWKTAQTPAPASEATPSVTDATPAVVDPAAAPVEAPTDPLATLAEESQDDFLQTAEPDRIDGKEYYFNENKAKRLLQANSILKAVQDVLPNPTAESLKERIEMANAADVMLTTFDTGTPQGMDDVLALFRDRDPEKFGAFAIRAHEQLRTPIPGNPMAETARQQAEQAIIGFHDRRIINERYNDAVRQVDPGRRDKAIALAQNLDFALTGKFVKVEDLTRNNGPVDPIAAQRADLERREQAMRQAQQHQSQQIAQQWDNRIEQSQVQAHADPIATIVNKFESNQAMKPYLENIRQELQKSIFDEEAAHPEWGMRWKALRDRAATSRSETDLRALADYRRQIAESTLRRNAAPIIQKYSGVAQQAQAVAPVVAAGQVRNEPPLNGTPVRPGENAMKQAAANPDLRSAIRDTLRLATQNASSR